MRLQYAFSRRAFGKAPRRPYGTPSAPKYLSASLGELSAVPNPSIPPPRFRTVFPSRAARGSHPCRTAAPYLVPQGGEGSRGRGRYVPSRHQGVRRGARTGSLQELGTYRLEPPKKAPRRSPGLLERLTGWRVEIPSARGNVFPPGSDSRFSRKKPPTVR